MSKILVHIHSGPELKNKVTLGFLVALTAVKEGHELKMFLAADAVHLLNCLSKDEVVGQGTGDLKDHLDFIKNANTKIYVSGMSAKARGYDDSLLNGYNAEFAMPDILLNESCNADSVLCY
jgi:predicted peroxiredoxin